MNELLTAIAIGIAVAIIALALPGALYVVQVALWQMVQSWG